jgi:polysaccharide biosynthesis protein PslH
VAPLAIGRGIQNKVLEAMAMARPVIASGAAHQGIDAEAGADLIVAEDPESQVRHALYLLGDPARAAAIAASARRRMETRYRWEARLAPLTELLGFPPRRAAA